MFRAGLPFSRGRGEDRFYNSAKERRANQNRQNEQFRSAQSDLSTIKSSSEPDDGVGCDEPPKPVSSPAFEMVASSLSNLERFLQSITPSVPAQYLPKNMRRNIVEYSLATKSIHDRNASSETRTRAWRTCAPLLQPYFMLGDLWESFKEWSAYGAGVPLILNDSDSVVQYYVPYLSGIQIYVDSLKSSAKSRRPGADSDSDFRDSSSDGSSDSEPERSLKHTREQNDGLLYGEIPLEMDRLLLRDQPVVLQGDCSSDEAESVNAQGHLLFEYLEHDLPYSREPLADKILDLAFRFPELNTLRSCDLLPSSWISVAWYPIYRIPNGPTLRDLDACFLTYHRLYTPIGGAQSDQAPVLTHTCEADGIPNMSLPVFGLASYKFKEGSLWTPNGGFERQLAHSLSQSADNWLRERQVNHPDFLFFSHR